MIARGARLQGRYEVLSLLGSGGMGEVYQARDLRLHREVAVKVLPPRLAEDDGAVGRFLREARAMAALSHPNILSIHDYAVDGELPFMVTELLTGENLRERVRRGPLPWPEALPVAQGIADALAAGHARGVVHRDLKPENVFLAEGGGVRILDFGLARLQEPEPTAEGGSESSSAPTDPGLVMGTAPYMAPEQLRGQRADARSDVFAFGCVLFEMLTGRRPFGRTTGVESMAAVLHEPTPPLEAQPAVPAAVDELVRRCLEKDPGLRFASGQELAAALRSVPVAPEAAGPARARLRPWRRPALLEALLGALLVGGLALLAVRLNPKQGIRSLAVLPLATAEGSAELDYLGEGIAEGVIHDLAQVSGLRVMARSTSFRFKGGEVEPRKVGRDLNVDAVLAGRVVPHGDTALVEVELVEVATGAQLWGDRYPVHPSATPALEDQIAERISERLRLRLGAPPPERRPMEAQAHTYYLKGLYQLNKRTAEGFRLAEDLFASAAELDPDHPAILAAQAEGYALNAAYGNVPPGPAFDRAIRAARQALARSDRLAGAHAVLGLSLFLHQWAFSEAEGEFRQAIALEPGLATAHHWYGEFLLARGRTGAALDALRSAEALDPLSEIISTDQGRAYYYGRQYAKARAQCTRVLQLTPGFVPAVECIALAATEEGAYPEALARLEELERSSHPVNALPSRAIALARAGRKAEAEAALAGLLEHREQTYVAPYMLAMVEAALGRKNEAFALLEAAYQERSGWMPYLRTDPRADPLRGDPRLADLEHRVGLR